ncbi:hypothetical protein HDU96_002489 [Phlyctochytrium bullatum]|nr:hypothetical protein HDU96_002489 [Phlyctochytrium bullatum]
MKKKPEKAKKAAPVAVSSEIVDDADDVDDDAGLVPPPKGFIQHPIRSDSHPFSHKSVSDSNKELWLIRIPSNFPIDALSNLSLPVTPHPTNPLLHTLPDVDTGGPRKKKSKTSTATPFGLLDTGAEPGEMAEMACLLPDAASGAYRLATRGFARYLCVAPVVEVPGVEEVRARGEEARGRAYVEREHPEMKLQFEPFGGRTEGKALEAAMERKGGSYVEMFRRGAGKKAEGAAVKAGKRKSGDAGAASAEKPKKKKVKE